MESAQMGERKSSSSFFSFFDLAPHPSLACPQTRESFSETQKFESPDRLSTYPVRLVRAR